MAEWTQQNESHGKRGWDRWRLRIAAALLFGLVLLVVAYFAGGRREKSVEHRLAAIYTAHALATAGIIEDYLLSTLDIFIVERDATDEHLSTIEETLPSLADAWETESAEMRQVETLLDRRPIWERLRSLVGGWSPQDQMEQIAQIYHERVCERRAVRILIELRRYENRWGRWPDTLDEIRAQLPPEALSDPLGPRELVYELEPSGFLLYSTGRDTRNDVGDWDNHPIWPRHGLLKSLQKRQSR